MIPAIFIFNIKAYLDTDLSEICLKYRRAGLPRFYTHFQFTFRGMHLIILPCYLPLPVNQYCGYKCIFFMQGIRWANNITAMLVCKIHEGRYNFAGYLFTQVFKLVVIRREICIGENFRQTNNIGLVWNNIFHNREYSLNHVLQISWRDIHY